ncbi:Zinc finger, RING/FYVE/PHD-type [Trema orientale]|uniref:Zinc finger, RING/FYVE/PHD-type n=1 Tax=Trema orientale TaxID=63057 RepID=A0A2P5DMZ0_TREOI|nr:Zinc finger, RING/FYVE/PHD-type [Trema orientale]
MERTDEDVECDADDGYCKRDFVFDELDRSAYSSIFRCVPCNFNIVHLLCGPLPRTIQYQDHMHPLFLTPLVVEDDSGAYYCDVCEERRDERICVYYCEACKYVAHVHCLIPEITSVLTGNPEERDLILLNSTSRQNNVDDQGVDIDMEGNIKTLKDIINKLSEEDKERFDEHFYWHTNNYVVVDSTYGDIHGTSSTIPEKYFFPRSNFDFQRHVHKFDKYCNFRRLKLESSDLEVNVVRVKNYMVAWYLRNDLLNLFEKHGDDILVDDGSKLSPGMKSLAFHFLCRVIYDMGRTMKRDITEEHLREWYGYLKFARRMGLRMMFVYEKLERVKDDFFFQIQPSRLQYDIPNKLVQKKSRLQQQIHKVEADLKKCKEYSSKSSLQSFTLTKKSYWNEASKVLKRRTTAD